MTRIVLFAVLFALLLPHSTCFGEADLGQLEEAAMQSAVARVAPSVVRIQTVGGLAGAGRVSLGEGPCTGLVVSADGYIVSSSFNFVRKPTTILVELPDGKSRAAQLVSHDHSRALVLLKVDLKKDDPPLALAEPASADKVSPGAWAIAVGRTFSADQPNISVGIVSAVNRIWGKAVQTDAKVSPSNYGGPLVNIRGQVLGVLVPLSPQSNQKFAGVEWYDSGIGFAIPLTHIHQVLPKLKKGKDLYPGLLGINIKGRDLYSVAPVIANVRPGGPARAAGLQKGDKIVEINGQSIANRAQLMHQLGPMYAGDSVDLVVLREEQRLEFEVPLIDKLPPYAHPFLGILARRDNPKEAIVRYVFPESAAAAADLQPGDRIVKLAGKTIHRRNDLYDALVSTMPGEEIAIEWKRGNDEMSGQTMLGNLPTDVPARLPPAHQLGSDDAVTVEDVGIIKIKLPEFKNECLAYIPQDYNSAIPHGVLVWLQRPGQFDQKRLLDRWKEHCDANDLILLAPRARDADRWHPDEAEFVNRALANLAERYEVDAARTVVHGWEAGGVMAFYVFAADKSQIHGIAPVDAAMPARLSVPPLQPASRSAVYWAFGASHDAAPRIQVQLKEFTRLHYPVTVRKLDGQGRYLNDDEIAELVRWIDSLDRI